jgi:4-amino-4-deoxy-L-arabinose transferase-like glycosyltransferase
LRVAARLTTGAADFWENGYTFYFQLAQNVAAGNGLTFDGQPPTAFRVPVYPLFLATVTLGHKAFLPVVLAQASIGAATVLCGALLTAELFGSAAGITAAALAAAYPYYVVHDTALQETSLFTLLTAFSVLLLIRARRTASARVAALAGLTLAVDVLTRATILPFALAAPFWLAWAGDGGARRTCGALVCSGVLVAGLTPWLVRSYLLTGSPSLNTETGYSLWRGNNPYTFSHYPFGSIDQSTAVAVRALSPQDVASVSALGLNEALIDRWFLWKGLGFLQEHPWLTLRNSLSKIQAAFSWLPSPRRGFWPTTIYALTYPPIMTLGLVGMILTRRSRREHSIIYLLFLSFVLVTAVFFGHTSHRSFLDVYWIGYSAYVIARGPQLCRQRSGMEPVRLQC